MRRRTLLTVGLAGATLLALAGGTAALLQPARREGRLTDAGRAVFTALASAVLAGFVPAEPAARSSALSLFLGRVDEAIAGLSPALQAEVDELLTISASAPGRRLLVGLSTPWAEAGTTELQQALQGMRESGLALRQQAYHALRDLTNASWFSDPGTWAAIGYPGPREV